MARITLCGRDICSPHIHLLLEPELSEIQPSVTKTIQTSPIRLVAVQQCMPQEGPQSQGRPRTLRLSTLRLRHYFAAEGEGGFLVIVPRKLQRKGMRRPDAFLRWGEVREKLDS